jgi:cystathionine beta-lyase
MRDATLVTTLGRDPHGQHGIVNPPVYHASTVLFPTLDALEAARPDKGVYYGRYGTPTSAALQDALAALEGGHASFVTSSGKAAITGTLLALLGAGDHLLMTDSAYAPSRRFCDHTLARFGVETTYYDPLIDRAGLRELIRPTTRVVFAESPGSLTFEVQDLPALAEAAHEGGAVLVVDNTWASPLYLKPFALGADVSVQAATKYVGGHSDLMMGVVTTTRELDDRLRAPLMEVVSVAAPDDCYLALRGLRTLATRLARHQASGLELAAWLRARPEVARVLHPGLPDDPGHELWRRDFLGASGLFGLVLRPCSRAQLAAMLDHLELFGMGYSWGGYESLLIPTHPEAVRTAAPWRAEGPTLRIHVGLEDPADLVRDLEAGFARLAAAG